MPVVKAAPRPASSTRPAPLSRSGSPARSGPSSRFASPPPPTRSARPGPSAPASPPARQSPAPSASSAPQKDAALILFQTYFKSTNPNRTYAVQIKEAKNGNRYLVLTEGKRDAESADQVRKTRLFVYSEDFSPLFRMLHDTAQWIKANPLPEAVKARRDKFWAKKRNS